LIPLRDSVRPKTIPFVNYALVLINIYVFYIELNLSPKELEVFINNFGLIPQSITSLRWDNLIDVNYRLFLPLITSIFIHGSLLHLVGNMLYLWIFGDNVEDRLGHLKYLLFYLIAGLVGNLTHIYFNSTSTIPTIGASGAVAGVLGAYFLAFPKAKILALVPVFLFVTITQVRAVIFLFLWFFLQLINGLASFGLSEETQMVAWWAHIGGFVAGAVGYLVFRKRKHLEI
jgi:membrane associated rhomboid family serine protease